ncbi:GNAT family N-acetyltransferase [Prevotella communis]|uniref:GNAT family N-acetyltransferase n=1 Tax=Prevotella communis TaxID=2913614 RepID=UPI003570B6ED
METNRIILRPWRDSDAEVLYKWTSDPDVGPRAGWAPHPRNNRHQIIDRES